MLPSSVSGAVITAGVAVVLAVLAQLQTWRRTSVDRAYERRRAALLDVQDAALDLRDELRAYGEEFTRIARSVTEARVGEPGSTPRLMSVDPPTRALGRARGRVDVCGVRIDPTGRGAAVAAALDRWRLAAEEHFLSPSDTTAGTEDKTWSSLHLEVAAELTR